MKKKIFSLRETLFYQCIQSFMTECERNGLDIPIDMDVHWNSGFYNIFCDSLNLPPSKDRFAVQYIGTNLRNDFISLVQLDVSRSSITRKLWNDWSDQFSDILKSEGASSWETEDINLSGSSLKIIDALDNKLLKPISSLLGVEVKDALNIHFLLDDKGNDTHSLARYRELLLFWIVSHLNISKDKRQRESKVSVLSALSKRTSPPPLFRNS